MSNTINGQLLEQYYEEAYDIYWHEGFRGDALEEMCEADALYRLEWGDNDAAAPTEQDLE